MHHPQPRPGLNITVPRILLVAGLAFTLSACSSAPQSHQARSDLRVTCANSLQRDLSAPLRPGTTCLEVAGPGDAQGAPTLRTTMKAVRLDGRVFFVTDPPAALARANLIEKEPQP